MMEYKQWLAAIAQVVNEFSSQEFQERVWLKGAGPEVSSYEEAACRFFDDYAANTLIDVEWRQAGLTESQRQKLAEFRDILESFGKLMPNITPPNDVLDNPNWCSVQKSASEALKELNLGGYT
jgi:hypothetical protein